MPALRKWPWSPKRRVVMTLKVVGSKPLVTSSRITTGSREYTALASAYVIELALQRQYLNLNQYSGDTDHSLPLSSTQG